MTRRKITLAAVLVMAAPLAGPAVAEEWSSPREDVRVAIRKARGFIESKYDTLPPRYQVLTAYAMLKSGSSERDPMIAEMIGRIVKEVADGQYERPAVGERVYVAGLHAMILADAGGEKYVKELEVIRDWLINEQNDQGAWAYTRGKTCDMSVTQYAVLGLWAAERAGAEVPLEVWSKIARFHGRAQLKTGGYPYHAFASNDATMNMTAAGIGSMAIARMHLPKKSSAPDAPAVPEGLAGVDEATVELVVRYGILHPVDEEAEHEAQERAAEAAANPRPDEPPPEDILRAGVLDGPIDAASGYLNRTFDFVNDHPVHLPYWYYTLERCASLSGRTQYRGIDWYETFATALIEQQDKSGAWTRQAHYPHAGSTAFIVLFLARPTAKYSTAPPRASTLSGGLLAGGRGLPEDLSRFGEEEDKPRTAFEELLAKIAKADAGELPSLQDELVEQVQLSDRDELIGQVDRLVELADNSEPEIRRTVLWAIGRTGELKLARYPIRALDDDSLAVLTEARNALAWISRDPTALGFPESPLEGVEAGAAPAVRNRAIEQWREGMIEAWGRWYLDQSPYGQRFDEFELDLRRRLGRK